ncbi:MAG: sulfatase-like hydrolase/transferase [Chitinophagales bacterium]
MHAFPLYHSSHRFAQLKQFFLLGIFLFPSFVYSQAPKPNIIFIVFDDLNDYVEGFNGHPQIETPNLFALGQKGTLFLNAFTTAPLCGPSRASFLLGKYPDYTGIYRNEPFNCNNFRSNFPDDKYLVTVPEWLKDSAGYFTYNIDKIFHCDTCSIQYPDFDKFNLDPCARSLSWSKQSNSGSSQDMDPGDMGQGLQDFAWGAIDSEAVSTMADFKTADTAMYFLEQYNNNPGQFCNKPFFLAIGIRKPHSNLYIPAQYFLENYVSDFYSDPFLIPYNDPSDANPPNGLIMPPQPDSVWNDYEHLPPLAKNMVDKLVHDEFITWPLDSLEPLPEISPYLNDEERLFILSESKRANAILAYMAAIKFADEQVGKIFNKLAEYPGLYNNTVIVVTSDHGFSLGEKKVWDKARLWETNIRVPLIITDLRNIEPQTCDAAVSLIDLFPTFCDFASVPYPQFPDGIKYPDGISLLPLLNNPDTSWERPVLTQIIGSSLNCFPQNSVRNDQWHYIYYSSNNAVGLAGCDSTMSYHNNELYEIGKKRNIDPEEWNNLANDENYGPVIWYLEQFLPDSDLFATKPFALSIIADSIACYNQYASHIQLFPEIFSHEGSKVDHAGLINFSFRWTNNLDDQTSVEPTYAFDLNSLPPEKLVQNGSIFFYLNVYDKLSNKLLAFAFKRIAFNWDSNAPVASYETEITGMQVSISNNIVEGNYNYLTWDYGDGFISGSAVDHIYTEEGQYTISNIVNYGKGCNTYSDKMISVPVFIDPEQNNFQFMVFPNPSTGMFTIAFSQTIEEVRIRIINLTGTVMRNYSISDYNNNRVEMNIEGLSPGVYFMEIVNDKGTGVKMIELMR